MPTRGSKAAGARKGTKANAAKVPSSTSIKSGKSGKSGKSFKSAKTSKPARSAGKATPSRRAKIGSPTMKSSKTPAKNLRPSSRPRSAPKGARGVVEVSVEATPRDDRPIEVRIAERAYLLWCERGGNETLNWLEAEREIRGR